ncbi:MAG: WD40 repeat domain-containing protein [Rhodoplanes sp.]|uniref:WD40 repeat domain-containing protein n=1 Tax=Rhodoplanes sp. TaxID=1968906 RepID=UPI0017D35778|nr:WD40 repeat domain-containing protein [Rhodoplanes sp.]NVO14270.1 WD40 repeat domain-containing protein [Rhodoplanes sp.]
MSDTSVPSNSLVERTRAIDAGAPVVAVGFVGPKGRDTAAFALGEETVLLVGDDGTERHVAVHGGGILCAMSDGARLITGGDDGRVMATAPDGTVTEIAVDAKRRWIDRVAAGRDGVVAWSAGKQVFARTSKGEVRATEVGSSVGGLAFAPKGLRLAIAHYNGASLWFPNAQTPPESLEWKGSHIGVSFSPDGRFLVTSMQEPALHGWRLADSKHMRMMGYAAKVRAMSWTADGRELATSGADTLVIWPFHGKDGPMGQQPRLLAPTANLVVAVACHPGQPVAAVGYDNGMVLLVRLEDAAEIVVRHPGGSAVSALGWNAAGTRLGFGTEDGAAGLLAL